MVDRAAPGVRIRFVRDLDNLEDALIDPLVQDRLRSFEYQDETKKRSKVKMVFDNHHLALFDDSSGLLGGGILLVSWGYRDRMTQPHTVVLKKVHAGQDTLTVEGYDIGVFEGQVEQCRSFENMTRSEIAHQIADEQGFAEESRYIDDTQDILETVVQAGWTNDVFLRRLADKEGYEYFINTKGLHFKEQHNDQAPTRVLTWYGGKGTLISWSADGNLIRRVGGSTSKGRDPETKEETEFRANSDTVEADTLAPVDQVAAPEHITARVLEVPTAINLESGAELDPNEYGVPTSRIQAAILANPGATVVTVEQDINGVTVERQVEILRADSAAVLGPGATPSNTATSTTHAEPPGSSLQTERRAKARYKKAARDSIKMKLKILGDPEIAAGSVIRVEGIGPWLSGLYYVDAHTHKLSNAGYFGSLKVRADGVNKALDIYYPKGYGAAPNEKDPTVGAVETDTAEEPARELEPIDIFDAETGTFTTVWK